MAVTDWGYPFEIMCDTNNFAIGAMLCQRKDKVMRAIYYASRTLNEAQGNYTTTEKEMLVVVYSYDMFLAYCQRYFIRKYTGRTSNKVDFESRYRLHRD